MKTIVRLTDNIIKRISKVAELQQRFSALATLAAALKETKGGHCGSCGPAGPARRKVAKLLHAARQQLAAASTEDAKLLKHHTGGRRLSVYYRASTDGQLRVEHRML